MFYQDKTILITGASSGIGFALAKEFVAQGARVVLVARRRERLDALAAELNKVRECALTVVADVTKREQLDLATEKAVEKFGKLDLVIANAGFGVVGPTEKLTAEDFRRQIETNVFGVLNTFWATAAALKESRGHLAIVGSVMGYVALPDTAPYSLSKFAVRGLADSLYHEMKKKGVAVTYIAPGFVRSEIRHVDNLGGYHEHVKDPVPQWIQMPADIAARYIVRKLRRRPRELIVTMHGKFLIWLMSHLPSFSHLVISTVGAKGRQQPNTQDRLTP